MIKNKKIFSIVLIFTIGVKILFLLFNIRSAKAEANIELYPNFHTIGVIITIGSTDDSNSNATTKLEYRTGSNEYKEGFSLTRTALTQFTGSIFNLEPGKIYDVKVTLTDPGEVLHNTTVSQTISTRQEISLPNPIHEYYVSPTGTGSTCTDNFPCDLLEGLNKARAGDHVILKKGVYNRGEFTLNYSGIAGSPIVIRGEIGDTAILDGADMNTNNYIWTLYENGIYQTTINYINPRVIIADGKRLFRYGSLLDLQNLKWGFSSGYFADNTNLYIRLEGYKNPNNASIVLPRYKYSFHVENVNYIYFDNITFKHYGRDTYSKAIYFRNSSDNLVQNCKFIHNDLGIGIKLKSDRILIQGNEFNDSIYNWSWDAIKSMGGLEDGAIVLYSPFDGRGTVIRRNIIHDDFDGLHVGIEDTSAVTSETDVYENKIYNLGDDGMEADGICKNVRIWGNVIYDVLVGISIAPGVTGPTYAIRNLIYKTGQGNNNYGGTPFKFNVSEEPPSGHIYIFHNTADAYYPGNNGIDIKEPGEWKMIYARNNIWSGTSYALTNYNTSQPVDLNYNNLYSTDSSKFVRWNNVNIIDLTTFRNQTGQEINGYNLPPEFTDPNSGDYTLAPISQLIDKGIFIPGINDGYSGRAPDLGAFEFKNSNLTIQNSILMLLLLEK
ncbi:MAG: right-handed parallel beta-helix repeat-containing protein [Desulfobacterales bacterium]|nr:right-handed parallel beta-helix repeat-containing protein [Desulfobacterales bacterium]